MKIGIIGIGCVGTALQKDFIDKNINISIYDKYKNGATVIHDYKYPGGSCSPVCQSCHTCDCFTSTFAFASDTCIEKKNTNTNNSIFYHAVCKNCLKQKLPIQYKYTGKRIITYVINCVICKERIKFEHQDNKKQNKKHKKLKIGCNLIQKINNVVTKYQKHMKIFAMFIIYHQNIDTNIIAKIIHYL